MGIKSLWIVIMERFTMQKSNSLIELRAWIDQLDDKLFEILEKRFEIIKKISKIKRKKTISVIDIEREKKIIKDMIQKHNKLNPALIKNLLYNILDYSREYQLEKGKNKKIIEDLKKRPLLIAGPCSVESKEQIKIISNFLKKEGIKFLRGGIFKPRTSPESFQGLGVEGLTYLREIAIKNNQYIVIEVMTPEQLDQVYDFVDILQVGSRNMSSFGLLKAIGKRTASDKKPVLLKRGMDSTINEFLSASRYITQYGNNNVILCLRGIRTFEQIDSNLRNTPDLASILELKEKTNKKIIFDPSHAAGNTKYIGNLSKAAIALGADGLMIEVHNNPSIALSDGKQSLNFKQFNDLLKKIK